MANENILLLLSDSKLGQHLEADVLSPAGYMTTFTLDPEAAEALLQGRLPELVLIDQGFGDGGGLSYAGSLLERYPQLPIILLAKEPSEQTLTQALRFGLYDYVRPPVEDVEVLQAVGRVLGKNQRMQSWARKQLSRSTASLQQRLDSLETLQRVGRKVTSTLDLDSVLTEVVDAAVRLTGAEEGSLLLVDEKTGELYMRASRNFRDDFVKTFRLPITDSLAGQVIRTGQPLLMNEDTPQKIKTAYLVHTIIYVPLVIHDRVIGVLEVDNRQSQAPFHDTHITLVSALADYAAIAIENARLYAHSVEERNKLETLLSNLVDGVIVVDPDERIMMVNQSAREIFGLSEQPYVGKPVRDVFTHSELLEILVEEEHTEPTHMEINLDDGRVLNAQITPISEVGLVMTMQDITYLKELDRIKTDFVNTVSHDLRSPLTAILGYVELVERVGPLTPQQREFIRRVEYSVHSITSLINDLLDLGRIEAGFDSRKEVVPLLAVLRYAVDNLSTRLAEKELDLKLDVPSDLAPVLGNPIRLRQMLNNLIGNAIKYTPQGGRIDIGAREEGGQVLLRIHDTGPGIPAGDQPFIFDKFYRASNVPSSVPGTGLGLAIVKSIVENHRGRIWVDSSPGMGTTFSIVLPVADQEL